MKPTLLIADRDAEACALYQQFLTARGYDVETSAHGLDCMDKLRRLMPAVLVLDPDLHWGGGDGVLAWLREEKLTAAIRVILTATAGYLQEIAECIEPHALDYLPKPFALTALLEKVHSAVANKGRTEPSSSHPIYTELFIG